MKAPAMNTKPRALCPRGIHLARCVQVVDLGTQHFIPTDDGSRKLYFGFETCNQKHVFDEDEGEQPFMLQSEFAFYMNGKKGPTKLRQFITQWLGKDFPSEKDATNFDFSSLLGKLAMLTVAHKPKMDGTPKAIIADIYAPNVNEARLETPAVNPLVCYEISNGEDAAFAKLPEFLQRKIRESDEFGEKQKPGATNWDEPASALETPPKEGDPDFAESEKPW